MSKRIGGAKKRVIAKKGPARTARKLEMLRIKAMKPAERKKALAEKKKK
jgi:hypothetical protein